MWQFLKRTWHLFKPFRRNLLVSFFLLVLIQILSLTGPFLLGRVVDGLNTSSRDYSYLSQMAGLVFLVSLASIWMNFSKDKYEIRKMDFSLPPHIINQVMNNLLSLSVGQHKDHHSGLRQSIITKGVESLINLVYTSLYDLLPTVAIIVFQSLAIFFLISHGLGVVVIGFIVLYFFISLTINRMFCEPLKELEKKCHEPARVRAEILVHISTIKMNSGEKSAMDRLNKKIADFSKLGISIWLRHLAINYWRPFLGSIAKFIAIFLAIFYVYKGWSTTGQLVTFIFYALSIFNALFTASYMHRRLMMIYPSAQKFFELLDIKSNLVMAEEPLRLGQFREITFKDVSFTYPRRKYVTIEINDEEEEVQEGDKENCPALTDVAFTIPAGKTVAIVGPSGSGKTTIANLLLRFFDPDSGVIKINGHDLKNLDLPWFLGHVGVVEQNPLLCDDTLRANLMLGMNSEKKIGDDELMGICEKAGMHDFLKKMSNGLETIIGENGVRLSGGEKQRVVIARALLRDPAILILDEATASLDSKNERSIHEYIRQAAENRTTIIIAHRLSTIKDADQIIVMSEGRVVGSGTHAELLKSCIIYQGLISNQVTLV